MPQNHFTIVKSILSIIISTCTVHAMKFKCTSLVLDESPIKNSLPVKRTSPPSISPGDFISTTLRLNERAASFSAIVSPLLEACPEGV